MYDVSVRLLSFELVRSEVGITCGIINRGYNLHFKELKKLMKNKPQEIKESKVLQELQKQKEIESSLLTSSGSLVNSVFLCFSN